MIVKEGLEVYPLRRTKVSLGEQTIWEQSMRNKSWFILDLALPAVGFVPAESTGLITAEGKRLFCGGRRR